MRPRSDRALADFDGHWQAAVAAEATNDGRRYVDAVKQMAKSRGATALFCSLVLGTPRPPPGITGKTAHRR